MIPLTIIYLDQNALGSLQKRDALASVTTCAKELILWYFDASWGIFCWLGGLLCKMLRKYLDSKSVLFQFSTIWTKMPFLRISNLFSIVFQKVAKYFFVVGKIFLQLQILGFPWFFWGQKSSFGRSPCVFCKDYDS